MSFRPLVVMKSKMGELEAVCEAVPRPEARTTILVELLDSITVGGRLLPALVRAAEHMAEHEHPLWIDAQLLGEASSLSRQPGGPFEFLDNRIEAALQGRLGLLAPDVPALVPVIPDSAADGHLAAISLLQEHRQRDVVVRIRNLDIRPSELADRLRHIVRVTRVEAGHVHAVIDLGYIDAVQVAQVQRASNLADVLIDHLGPMSTALLSGSIPADRKGFVTTTLDRPELPVWRAVNESREELVHYGDYGVVHPAPTKTGPPGPRPVNPYLYYTVPERMISLRRKLPRENGKPIKGAAGEVFARLATEITERSEFEGPGYSWGDNQLMRYRHNAASGGGSVSRWVAIGTSHHLEHLARRTSLEP
jgi:hypothetical protein